MKITQGAEEGARLDLYRTRETSGEPSAELAAALSRLLGGNLRVQDYFDLAVVAAIRDDLPPGGDMDSLMMRIHKRVAASVAALTGLEQPLLRVLKGVSGQLPLSGVYEVEGLTYDAHERQASILGGLHSKRFSPAQGIVIHTAIENYPRTVPPGLYLERLYGGDDYPNARASFKTQINITRDRLKALYTKDPDRRYPNLVSVRNLGYRLGFPD